MGKAAGNGSSPVYVQEIPISVPVAIATGVFTSLKNSSAAFLGTGAMILRAYLRITTASTGAGTIDIGITAVSATTASDVLFDGLSTAATGVFDSMDGTDNGSNGVAKPQVWAEDAWVTLAEASGDLAGLVGTLYIEYTYL
jgi:hypothetical protein